MGKMKSIAKWASLLSAMACTIFILPFLLMMILPSSSYRPEIPGETFRFFSFFITVLVVPSFIIAGVAKTIFKKKFSAFNLCFYSATLSQIIIFFFYFNFANTNPYNIIYPVNGGLAYKETPNFLTYKIPFQDYYIDFFEILFPIVLPLLAMHIIWRVPIIVYKKYHISLATKKRYE